MSYNKQDNKKDSSNQSEKAAQTRKENDSQAFSKMGQKGAEARHDKSAEEESRIAKEAAQTRKENDSQAFSKMGQKGGSQSSKK